MPADLPVVVISCILSARSTARRLSCMSYLPSREFLYCQDWHALRSVVVIYRRPLLRTSLSCPRVVDGGRADSKRQDYRITSSFVIKRSDCKRRTRGDRRCGRFLVYWDEIVGRFNARDVYDESQEGRNNRAASSSSTATTSAPRPISASASASRAVSAIGGVLARRVSPNSHLASPAACESGGIC